MDNTTWLRALFELSPHTWLRCVKSSQWGAGETSYLLWGVTHDLEIQNLDNLQRNLRFSYVAERRATEETKLMMTTRTMKTP